MCGVHHWVPELVLSSLKLVLFSAEMKDWNRRLKICKIFTAAKLLDLLASTRTLVERSNLTTGFLKLVKSRQRRKILWRLTYKQEIKDK